MLSWRELFDDLGIEYKDKGKNCSAGNINISCPFCADDPSQHLAVSERKIGYYCYREPNSHSGSSINRLLVALGIDYFDIPNIINQYDSDIEHVLKPKPAASLSAATWDKFLSATESSRCLQYLTSRGFPSPHSTARQYDLRFAEAGTWAGRLLLPICEGDSLISWTGRSLLTELTPKYYTRQTDQGNYLYLPRAARETLILVEGPMDALKICAATSSQNVTALALLGKQYNQEKLDKIASLMKGGKEILIALDDDVSLKTIYELIYELSSRTNCSVRYQPLPYGVHDPGEMDMDQIGAWCCQ